MKDKTKSPAATGCTLVPDEHITMIWECAECGEDAHVKPTFYECNGTPVCPECGDDMSYVKTMVLLPLPGETEIKDAVDVLK
jgi:hypothetical protein